MEVSCKLLDFWAEVHYLIVEPDGYAAPDDSLLTQC